MAGLYKNKYTNLNCTVIYNQLINQNQNVYQLGTEEHAQTTVNPLDDKANQGVTKITAECSGTLREIPDPGQSGRGPLDGLKKN